MPAFADPREGYQKWPGFKSERWPASSRNGGRLQIGMVADINSEWRPASHWNDWPDCVGICNFVAIVDFVAIKRAQSIE
jgi:hypothetical protein